MSSLTPTDKITSHDHPHRPPFWVTWYDTLSTILSLGKTKRIHQATLNLCNIQPGEAVLDVGCGTGLLALLAQEQSGSERPVIGLDVEPAMIAQARHHAVKQNQPTKFEVASITDIPYPDETFDVVLSTLMIHHLSLEQRERGLYEVYRVLKRNGRLLVVDFDPTQRSLITRLHAHNGQPQQDYVQMILPDLLQAIGFTKVQVGGHPFKQFSYALAWKVQVI